MPSISRGSYRFEYLSSLMKDVGSRIGTNQHVEGPMHIETTMFRTTSNPKFAVRDLRTPDVNRRANIRTEILLFHY